MAFVVRLKTPLGLTSAAAACGTACASETTIPFRTSFSALATFSGVMKLVVPLDSCPTGAHLPHVLNSVRHFSYCALSAAVSLRSRRRGSLWGWCCLDPSNHTRDHHDSTYGNGRQTIAHSLLH